MSPRRAIALGALTIGTLDIVWAIANAALLNGRGPEYVLQSVAGGLHGSATFQGGIRTAMEGLLIHYSIATCVMTAYLGLSRVWALLVRRPWICGALYGMCVYVVMYQFVLPHSAYHSKGIIWSPAAARGLFIHVFGVGLPAALFSRRARA